MFPAWWRHKIKGLSSELKLKVCVSDISRAACYILRGQVSRSEIYLGQMLLTLIGATEAERNGPKIPQ